MRTPRVAVTLADGGLAGLDAMAPSLGVEISRVPLVRFEPPASWHVLDQALERLETTGTLVVTSPRAAAAVAGRLAATRQSGRLGAVAWAIGAATAEPLRRWFETVRIPERPSNNETHGGWLGRALVEHSVEPPVIHPCGTPHRPELAARLRRDGIEVRTIEAYRCLPAPGALARRVISEADFLIVGSSTAVRCLARHPGRRPRLIALGAITAGAARRAGLEVIAVAPSPDVAGVAAAIAAAVRPSRTWPGSIAPSPGGGHPAVPPYIEVDESPPPAHHHPERPPGPRAPAVPRVGRGVLRAL